MRKENDHENEFLELNGPGGHSSHVIGGICSPQNRQFAWVGPHGQVRVRLFVHQKSLCIGVGRNGSIYTSICPCYLSSCMVWERGTHRRLGYIPLYIAYRNELWSSVVDIFACAANMLGMLPSANLMDELFSTGKTYVSTKARSKDLSCWFNDVFDVYTGWRKARTTLPMIP